MGTKILLVDDDKFFLKVLSDAFEEAGYTVYAAKDGAQGVQFYLEVEPEVVISDLVMPGMGGVSTCMEISRLAASLDRDPITVLLTSMFQEPPHEHQIAEMGAKVHLPKTTKPMDVVIIVEQLLERKRKLQAAP
jgi:CheY-like chemotaxis protein